MYKRQQQDLWQFQKGEASSSETPLSEQNYPTVSVQDLYDIAAIEATYAASSPEDSEVSGIETTEESEETAVFQNNTAQVSTNAGSDETYKADNGKIDRWWATAGQKEPVSVTWTVKVDESDDYRLDIDIENWNQWDLTSNATVLIWSDGSLVHNMTDSTFNGAGSVDLGRLEAGKTMEDLTTMKVIGKV